MRCAGVDDRAGIVVSLSGRIPGAKPPTKWSVLFPLVFGSGGGGTTGESLLLIEEDAVLRLELDSDPSAIVRDDCVLRDARSDRDERL